MKKIYILLLVCFGILFQVSAQQIPVGKGTPVQTPFLLTRAPLANDTLRPASFGPPLYCDTALRIYSFGTVSPADSGYAFGNNVYGETECAQRYLASGTVSEVLAYIGITRGTTDSAVAKIYSVTAAGKPNAVLGTSHKVAVSAISTTALTAFTFSTNVTVTTKYFADITFPTTAGDTVGLVTTKFGCASDTMSSYVKIPAFGNWLNVKTTFADSLDIVILPVMATTVGVDAPQRNGLKLFGAFPNPAVDFTSIRYSLNNSTNVSITVFDLKGRIVKLITDEKQDSGNHELMVDTRELTTGNYYYNIRTGSSNLTGKFEVSK